MASSGWQGEVTLTDGGFGYSFFKGDLRIDSISHSGNTVTVTGVYAVKNTRSGSSYAYYIDPIKARAAGNSYVEVVAGNQHINDGSTVSKNVTFTFTAGATETSKQITMDWLYYNGGHSNSINYTLYFDASPTAPTGLNVTSTNPGRDSVSAYVSVTGWGGAGDANTRYRELQVWSGNMTGSYRKQAVHGNTLNSEITCNNSSSGSLTISPNTQYYIGAYADNGSYNTGSQPFGTVITDPPAIGGSVGTTTHNSASISWSLPAQGGARQINITYEVDGGSDIPLYTVTGTNAVNGSFTLGALTPNTTYSVTLRADSGLSSSAKVLTVHTANIPTKMYCSVNNTAKKVKRIYCSVGGQRKKVKKIYCSVNGVAKLAFEDAA